MEIEVFCLCCLCQSPESPLSVCTLPTPTPKEGFLLVTVAVFILYFILPCVYMAAPKAKASHPCPRCALEPDICAQDLFSS